MILTKDLLIQNSQRVVRGKHKGFTLIELMIAVAIVAVLATIMMPIFTEQVRKARRADAKADLMDLAQRQERLYSETGSYGTILQLTGAATYETEGGMYNITVVLPGGANPQTYDFTANAQNGQSGDTYCGNFTLDEAGVRGISGPVAHTTQCWN